MEGNLGKKGKWRGRGWWGEQKEQRCNPMLMEISLPSSPAFFFPFFLKDVQGYLVSAQVPFWLFIICICSVPQDFYSGGPISSLKARQVRKLKGIFPVNILWATPGKGNQQPLLPVFIQILGANNIIFYSSKNSWGPRENRIGNVTGLKNLLLLRTQFCQTWILWLRNLIHAPGFQRYAGPGTVLAIRKCCQLIPTYREKTYPTKFSVLISLFLTAVLLSLRGQI